MASDRTQGDNQFLLLRYRLTSVQFNPVDRTWTGTFIPGLVPLGHYEKVELAVKDDFGQQAKCPAGNIAARP